LKRLNLAKKEQEITVKDIEKGAVVTEPGSAEQYRSGDWRSQRPVIDRSECIKCGFCFLYCPEGCVKQTKEGYFEPDMYYCKGCGICAVECPKKCIKMQEEKGK
jgi:pyruvate ferredoxin oxidoreductase delta subunit